MAIEVTELLKKDFGTIEMEGEDIHPSTFPLRGVIKTFLTERGYDVKHNDVCSIISEWQDKRVEIFFKFIHESVMNVEMEPYYKVIFVEK